MRTAIVGLILICGLQIIKADDMKVLFLAPPDAKIKTNRQFAPAGGFGEVSISEVSLAKKISASDSSLESVRQHAEYFDFYLVPIKFGVLGFDGKTCKWIQVGATLRSSEEDNGKIFILNIFPATSLKKGSIGTDGKLIISSDLKVAIPEAAPASGSVSVGGSANINWNWSPLYQEVAAIHDQSRAIWRFDAVGSEFPVGEVDVATIVAVAKSLSNPSTKIDLELEMRASFGGGWFDSGLANTKATVLVKLP
jgi:hypothetical protein